MPFDINKGPSDRPKFDAESRKCQWCHVLVIGIVRPVVGLVVSGQPKMTRISHRLK